MSINRYSPHIFVLPEDDANGRLATGFVLGLDWSKQSCIRILPEAGGWLQVLAQFKSDHIFAMEKYDKRFMILVIDFDGDENRLKGAKAAIPQNLSGRVFIIGACTEPEALRNAGLGSFEKIGSKVAEDCRNQKGSVWEHELLRCNADEVERLRQHVRPILFA